MKVIQDMSDAKITGHNPEVFIFNGMVAVEPIDFEHAKGEKQQLASRFVTTDRVSNSIVQSKAVFSTMYTGTQSGVYAGNTVLFRADVVNIQSTRQVLEYNGKKFVLIPIGAVVGVEA